MLGLSLSLTRAGLPVLILLTEEGAPLLTEEGFTIRLEVPGA